MGSHETSRLYSPRVRTKIEGLIRWKPQADKESFFEAIEALGRSLKQTRNPSVQDPRLARNVLADIAKQIRKLENAFQRLDRLQENAGTPRRVMARWGAFAH